MSLIFVLLLLPLLWRTVVGHNATHYTAAVVEYFPKVEVNLTGEEDLMRNIASYEEAISCASSQGADILVFPEAGLTGVFTNKSVFYSEVPHPRQAACPCLQPSLWSTPLVRLSCAARSNGIYVAVNLNEKEASKRHSANVVFDRQGVVVSRYRKLHLFGDANLQVPDEIDHSVFRTDFGVTFGQAICFDLLFEEPARKLVRDHNIRHFIFSAAWFSERPLLMATQVQAAWSWSNDAVLLASGLNDPSKGCTGSGIYAGRLGAIKTVFTGKKTTELIIGALPKQLNANGNLLPQSHTDREHFDSILHQELYLLQDHLSAFTTVVLPSPDTSQTFNRSVCHGEFCCRFDVSMEYTSTDVGYPSCFEQEEPAKSESELSHCIAETSTSKSLYYRLFSWDGVRDCSGQATLGIQTCGVMACRTTDDVTSCGLPLPQDQLLRKTNFLKLEISGIFRKDNTMMLADTLNQNLSPFAADLFSLREKSDDCGENNSGQGHCVTLKLLREQSQLQTFALYNREFGRDGHTHTHHERRNDLAQFNLL